MICNSLMASEKLEKVLKLADEKGILRPKEVEQKGLPRQYIYRLVDKGKLEKVGRGLYKIPEKDFPVYESLIETCKKIPKGVICLLSALQYHGMTTQLPDRVWIAIENKSWKPRVDLPVKIVWMSGDSFEKGIEEHDMNGVPAKIYNSAKTVADCFKFRNKIGLDVAIDSLKEYREEKKGTMDEVWKFAKINRVQTVIRPYMEAIS